MPYLCDSRLDLNPVFVNQARMLVLCALMHKKSDEKARSSSCTTQEKTHIVDVVDIYIYIMLVFWLKRFVLLVHSSGVFYMQMLSCISSNQKYGRAYDIGECLYSFHFTLSIRKARSYKKRKRFLDYFFVIRGY